MCPHLFQDFTANSFKILKYYFHYESTARIDLEVGVIDVMPYHPKHSKKMHVLMDEIQLSS